MKSYKLLTAVTTLLSFLGVTVGVLGVVYGFTLVINTPIVGILTMLGALIGGLLIVAFSEACSVLVDVLGELREMNSQRAGREAPPQFRRRS